MHVMVGVEVSAAPPAAPPAAVRLLSSSWKELSWMTVTTQGVRVFSNFLLVVMMTTTRSKRVKMLVSRVMHAAGTVRTARTAGTAASVSDGRSPSILRPLPCCW